MNLFVEPLSLPTRPYASIAFFINEIRNMKMPRRFLLICFSALICLGLPTHKVVAFQDGANGEHGIDGDPGTDGDHGQSGAEATSIVLRDSDKQWETTLGGRGGDGGNGGNGIDGEDADWQAAGGDAGDGGSGGNATQFWINNRETSHTYALGGDGGSGGMYGMGTTDELNGRGGNGGHGGDATAVTSTDGQIPYTIAVGGNGGNAYGLGAIGGSGGSAVTQSNITGDGLIQEIRAFQYGGNGGFGSAGAEGGRGASVYFTWFEMAQDLFFTGYGGNGGSTENGTAGLAGSASFDLNETVNIPETQPRNFHDTSVTLFGGYGGRGMATGSQNVSGANGGTASVNVLDARPVFTKGETGWNFKLRGGNGGSALGPENSGNGGHGATASFSAPASFDNTIGSIFIPFVKPPVMDFRAIVEGGDGGHAHGSGLAGNGADVNLVNQIFLRSNGLNMLNLTAIGGSGGWGNRNGNGGNATVESVKVIDEGEPEFRRVFANKNVRARAIGGHAGQGRFAANHATGGDARSVVVESSFRSVLVSVYAAGGMGNLGASGDSHARAIANTVVPISERHVSKQAYAKARALPAYADITKSLPSIGTNAFAEARATNDTNGQPVAIAEARSGWGNIRSGSANAIAVAESRFGGITYALSTAFATGDRDPETENYANSLAAATTHSRAGVRSTAGSVGHFSKNHAVGEVTARVAGVNSISSSSTTNWKHDIQISTDANFESSSTQRRTIRSSGFSGFRQSEFESTVGYDAAAHVLLVPDQSTADAIVVGHSQLADVFVGDTDATILGIGKIAGGFSNNQEGHLTVDTSVDLSLELQHFHNDKHMLLGLFNIDASGEGFSEMSFSLDYNNQSILDESFTTLDQALTFFDSPLFDLGALNNFEENNSEEEVRFSIDVSLTADSPMDAFEFGFVFGNADPRSPEFFGSRFSSVPEPSGAVVGWLVLIGFLKRKRATIVL